MGDNQFVYVELGNAVLADGSWIDGIAAGTFVDMWGQEVTISPADLEDYVKNTRRAIKATRTESGETVGLPIDARGHDHGDGAGWIVDAQMKEGGKVVQFKPKWTDVGSDLISRSIRRMFSPTLNLSEKVLIGGSLTNYPATRKKNGDLILKPVELSQGTDGAAFAGVTYAVEQGAIEMAEETKFDAGAFKAELLGEVKEIVKGAVAELAKGQPKPQAEPTGEQPDGALDFNAIMDRVRADLATEAAGEFTDLASARDAMLSQVKEALKAEQQRIQNQSANWLRQMMAESKRRTEIAEFSMQITGGKGEGATGLPVSADRIENLMLRIEDETLRAELQSVFSEIVEKGLVEFSERGEAGETAQKRELPAAYAEALRNGSIKLSDLSEPMIAVDLGDLSQYDLSEFGE